MSAHERWSAPPAQPFLGSAEVHLWRAYLTQPGATVKSLSESLTPDERQRADRFHSRKDREHFIVARGVLRAILSLYLGRIQPNTICFSYNRYGKPMLSPAMGAEWLRFNLAHSHEIALYAITRAREVGLDIEFIQADVRCFEIAERFFAPSEIDTLRQLPASLQTSAFFYCWTRKEAFIKALGEGLSHPLDQFAVSLAPGAPAQLLKTYRDPAVAARWSLVDIIPAPGYAGALAVEDPAPRLCYWAYASKLQ